MTLTEVLRELERLGTAQNRKVYARHGVGPNMFGVSYAHQKRLAKRIGTDQKLAEALWKTGNHDARVLATYIADAQSMPARLLDAWARDLDCYVLADALSGVACKAPSACKTMRKWIRSADEWIGRAGWQMVARLAMQESELSDAELSALLKVIERDIHARKNFTRHAMNMALISIGLRNAALRKEALRAGRVIGKVEVDHGQTGCKTPDAAGYIQKALAHRTGRSTTKRPARKIAGGKRERGRA